MGAADIPRMTRVAPAHVFGCALEHKHPRHEVARGHRCAERGVAAADYDDVVVSHRRGGCLLDDSPLTTACHSERRGGQPFLCPAPAGRPPRSRGISLRVFPSAATALLAT